MHTSSIRSFDDALGRLGSSLGRVEQAVQTLRWRLAHLPDDLSVVGQDVGSLVDEIGAVSRLFGELSVLAEFVENGGGIGVLAECGECFRPVCEGCSRQHGGLTLCEECYDDLAEEDADGEEIVDDETTAPMGWVLLLRRRLAPLNGAAVAYEDHPRSCLRDGNMT